MASSSPEVTLAPRVLEWARTRVGLSEEDLADKVGIGSGRVVEWERNGRITISQADRVAKATRTPVGYLYLSDPPEDRLPITDFRVVGDEAPRRPSPDLLAVLDEADRRQGWYHDYLISIDADPLDFVGSLSEDVPIVTAATRIRERHGLTPEGRAQAPTWEDALRLESAKIEQAGVMVMRSGTVGSNMRRKLDVEEFRGFAIADGYAPLIFINARDAKAAQMFTLVHELVHIWLGQSGVSNEEQTVPAEHHSERYCNAVAAEVLVPADRLRAVWRDLSQRPDALAAVGRAFKVSTLVVLISLRDTGLLDWATFRRQYDVEQARHRERATREGGGGDYYRLQGARLGKRFAAAVVESTLEGRTSPRQALPLLGVKKVSTFYEMARKLGFPV